MLARSTYTALWFLDEIFGTRRTVPFHQARKALHGRLTRPQGLPTRIAKAPEVDTDYLDAASLRRLGSSGPVVFRGLAAKVPAIKEWTLPSLAKRCGTVKHPVQRSGDQYHIRDVMLLSEALELIEAGQTTHSVYGSNVSDLLNDPKMQSELSLSSWADERYIKRTFFRGSNLFVSPAGHWSPVHSEVGALLSAQLRGSRRWTLYAPSCSPELFPEVFGGTIIFSDLYANATRLRVESFGLSGWECVLEEGDVLFSPLYYWHFVETLRTSISVATRWIPPRSILQHPAMTALFATRVAPNVMTRILGRKPEEAPNPLTEPYKG